MDSTGSISTLRARLMPSTALLCHDLRTLWGSWLVRLWLAATVLVAFFTLTANWAVLVTPKLIGALLWPYLVLPWFLVAVALGVNPVSGSRAESLADGFLSRPVTRYEYLLAAWAARVATVVGIYLLVVVPSVVLVVFANRPVAEDPVTLYGILGALSVTSLVLTLLVSLGFLLGTLLRRPLLSVVVVILVWCPIMLILGAFSLEEFSTITLCQAIPTLSRQPWSEAEVDSQEPLDDNEAERNEAERNEAERNEAIAAEAEAYDAPAAAAQFLNSMTIPPVPPPAPRPPPTPTPRKAGFFDRTDFEDFSLVRVMLGYGIPTLTAVALATFCFYWRDL